MVYLSSQTITKQEGLMFSLDGTEEERLHDINLLRGMVLHEIVENCLNVDGKQYLIYGEDAYVLRPWFQAGYKRSTYRAALKLLNNEMRTMREVVE